MNLLQAAETDVRFGNLLTMPIGAGTVIYVKPVYVEWLLIPLSESMIFFYRMPLLILP